MAEHGEFVDNPLCVCLGWALSGGHLWTELLVLLCISWGLVKSHKRGYFFFSKMCMKNLSAFQLVFRIFLEIVILSIACPQMPCLHGLLGLIILCLKMRNRIFYLLCAVADNCIESHQSVILLWLYWPEDT